MCSIRKDPIDSVSQLNVPGDVFGSQHICFISACLYQFEVIAQTPFPHYQFNMFRRSQVGSSTRTGTTGLDRTSSKRIITKSVLHKKIFSPFWKRPMSKHIVSKGSVFSWDEASYECQKSEHRSVTIDRIPTAIEYLSSSSDDHSLENKDELMETQSRYSVPMEIDQQVTAKQKVSDHCHRKDDNIMDKYSMIDEDCDNNNDDDDDDDDDKSTLFGSLENDSFTSDTALRDEINIEREKIKQSYIFANEKRIVTKQPFFHVSACFGHTNARNVLPESPIKHPYSIRYKLESDQFLRLE